ncbi:MAG: cysteine desulfurase [Longispora sp.]|nr:cysteine desulfurase [Longispora sp. (in: high G+C Gram-positive bacteria)]
MTSTIPAGKPQREETPRLDVEKVRADFPIFGRMVNGMPLVYLDSANTAQKPQQVIEAVAAHYALHNANVSRSVHSLGTEATEAYEGSRARIATFIGAYSPNEVVFTKNSTEAINLVAHAFSPRASDERFRIGPGDEIVISEMEHHSNIVPWQMLAERTGATLRWFGVTDGGRLDLSNLDEIVNERTKIVSYVHVSNILGTTNPTAQIVARARTVGALVMLDGAQSVPQMPVDVTELDVDFLAFTGHKMLGPTGIGCLWGSEELLNSMSPFLGGGSMIENVTMAKTTYALAPARFEAGTPPIAEAIGLGIAVDYLSALGMASVYRHEQEITAYALDALSTVPGLRIIGPAELVERGGTVSFVFETIHPHDVGQILDAEGVQVRVGHHCAKPTCARFGVPATTRASFYLYTTTAEVDALVYGLEKVRKVFG